MNYLFIYLFRFEYWSSIFPLCRTSTLLELQHSMVWSKSTATIRFTSTSLDAQVKIIIVFFYQ